MPGDAEGPGKVASQASPLGGRHGKDPGQRELLKGEKNNNELKLELTTINEAVAFNYQDMGL